MKKRHLIVMSLLLLLTGCAHLEETPPTPAEPVTLNVEDLGDIFSSLELSHATLTKSEDGDASWNAAGAICAADYAERLRSLTWKACEGEQERKENGYCCTLEAPGVTLTAFQSVHDTYLFQAETQKGEGLFLLPFLEDRNGKTLQRNENLYEVFSNWYAEAHTAAICAGTGTPLTAEELRWFKNYTASSWTDDGSSGATAISCFFTSVYLDPRDMDAEAFLQYCPAQGTLQSEDEEEFRLVQKKLDWRVGSDGHLAAVSELPVPCRRLPRTYINGILTQYAGITVEEMHTDWLAETCYIPETDCFYTFTSDFGPGVFLPCYGEKEGDVVTLWESYGETGGSPNVLVLEKSGEEWHILAHEPPHVS